MAYLRRIFAGLCQYPGCPRRATEALCNQRNYAVSHWCTRHAKNALAELQERERAEEKAL